MQPPPPISPPHTHTLFITIKDMHALLTTQNGKNVTIYIYVFLFVFCCCFLHFANATCRNVFFFYIFTSCGVTYPNPTVRKHHFSISDNTLFQFFMKVIYLFHIFLPIQIPECVGLGDTENHYETCLWCAVDFNNLKFISSSSVDAFEITCSCIFFRAVYDLFSMFFVLHVLTINDFFFS